jgi:hypothetical protein
MATGKQPVPVQGKGHNATNTPPKEVVTMGNAIDRIPEKTRWEIATQGMTGAFTAISKALEQAAGKKGFDEFNGPFWYQAGKGAKDFANTFGLATESAADIEGVTHLMAQTAMGPEFQFEVVEATQDRCVGRTTQCPWHKRWTEQGVDFDSCGVGHQSWGNGAVESMNPNYTFKLLKNMNAGDSHCEWVIERKK